MKFRNGIDLKYDIDKQYLNEIVYLGCMYPDDHEFENEVKLCFNIDPKVVRDFVMIRRSVWT